MYRIQKLIPIVFIILGLACTSQNNPEAENATDTTSNQNPEESTMTNNTLSIEAQSFTDSSIPSDSIQNEDGLISLSGNSWLAYDVNFETAGRYRVEIVANSDDPNTPMWLEDYIDNKDDRTYNVTGNIPLSKGSVEGSPFNKGLHKMKLHLDAGAAQVKQINFVLMKEQVLTPQSLTQSTEGDKWTVVWSDEFEDENIDTNKWTYDFGDWGWGNNELQYYTANDPKNARIEDGNLIIEAHKNADGKTWTSARLTTREKVSFLYGKIELRAKVPAGRGNWAAGWTLGDAYVDELSWPYCGEIDILESVGYEVDDETLNGIAHVTVHTPAYYFKINNQISNTKNIENIAGDFHTYSVEWTPTEIRGFVDGEEYYLYDKTANEKEWPFNQAQNIILNLAMGGGWGGAQGLDPDITSQQFILDYVRVYEKK